MTSRLPDTTRLEAFSDGVFAIAITLLVLQIRVPAPAEIAARGGLWPALGARWPGYLGYVISFLTIGIMWANHHSILLHIAKTDRRLILMNVLFLMGIGFLPFPTAVLAEHLADPGDRLPATVFYGATLVGIAALFNAVWWTGIYKNRLTGENADRAGIRSITARYRMGPFAYLAALALALVSVWLTLGAHLALAFYFMRPVRAGR